MAVKTTKARTPKRPIKNKKGPRDPFLISRAVRRIIALSVFLLVFIALGTFGLKTHDNANAADVNPAKVVSQQWKDSRTLDISITSPSIEGYTKTVRLLVPADWKTSKKTYPTLWLMHGGGGNFEDWTKNTDIAALTANRDLIVVMPDTSWCSAYTDWWNYGKNGKPAWDTFITSEVRQLLETSYKANTTRAIAGLSMGGLGAMKLPATHPGMFQAAASFSGNLDPLHAYNNLTTAPDKPGVSCLADWKRVWGDYTIPAQKDMWLKNDPFVQADKLASLKYLYVSSGDGLSSPLKVGLNPDPAEQEVNRQAQAMVAKLKGLNIPVDSHFYSGSHTWPYWQNEMHAALPGILTSLGIQP